MAEDYVMMRRKSIFTLVATAIVIAAVALAGVIYIWTISASKTSVQQDMDQAESRLTDVKTSVSNLEEGQETITTRVDKLDSLATGALNVALSNASSVKKIQKDYTELANGLWLRGRQNNDLLRLIFDLAYQGDSTTVAKGDSLYKQYAHNCANQSIWDSTVVNLYGYFSMLAPAEVEKVLKISEQQQKIAKIDRKLKVLNAYSKNNRFYIKKVHPELFQ